ncbi:protein kinase [Maudiozyma humilis]|uniref:non-specific serine/threonine protein kinase n=1 Tax=Maudiozyma humilis TaxID=51915 RepID=A0AAV5RQW7_MAUHU|nr:protein kinase [Kazachstania humilis]
MYSNLEQIQSGSFSTVYKAWCSTLNKYVALKVIPRQKYTEAGIMNEFRIMKLLGTKHPNICSMIDYYEDENNYILVLEYCECGDMYDFLSIVKRQGSVGHPALIQLDFIKIIQQLYSALNYAHSLGIAHRDIKPENILLTKEGNIKLADWGHATLNKVSKDFNIGTDNYRAPETFGCLNGYDTAKCDTWGVGVTLFYLMFGQCPFRNAELPGLLPNSNGSAGIAAPTVGVAKCRNFQQYLMDPYGFIYRYFLEPIVCVHQGNEYTSNEGKPSLYVWQDMVNIYQIFYVCRIIIDNLAAIDPDDRSMAKSLTLFEKVWNYNDQYNSNGNLSTDESNVTDNNNSDNANNSNSAAFMKDSFNNTSMERKQIISKSS